MAQRPKDKQPDIPPTRRGWATALGAEASLTAEAAFARAGFSDPTLVLRWEEIAGSETAALTQPISLKDGPSGGVLTLMAEPGAALFLQHESRALCERINAYLGRPAVARLKFIQVALTKREKVAPGQARTRPVSVADPVQKYEGPERLRAALLGLARTRRSDP